MMQRKTSALHYLVAYAALVVLVTLTLGLSFLELPAGGLPLLGLLTVGTVLIVVLVFMHLLEHASTILLVLVTGVFFLALLLTLMVLDVVARAPQTPAPAPVTTPDTNQEHS